MEGSILSNGVQNINGTVSATDVTTKRYHASARYATYNRTTMPLDMTIIKEICGDEDGCEVRLFMRRWNSNTETAAATRGPYVLNYDNATGRWRVNDTSGIDGNGTTNHLLQWWDCYLTDGNYSNGSNQNDPGEGISLLNYNSDYSNANKTCECTFID